MTLQLVSCLKCTFVNGDFIDGEKVYRCRAHALRRVNINNQIMCSRFRGMRKKTTNKEFRNKNEKVHLTNSFDKDPLYKIINERQENV